MVQKLFDPEKDITAWELAHIYMMVSRTPFEEMNPVSFTDEQWLALAKPIKRHFKDMPDETYE